MLHRRKWFDRTFMLRLPVEEFPGIVERLRGTPSRLAEGVSALPAETLVRRPQMAWSIQEQAGHLLDLEPLWRRRLDDLLRGAEVLEAADLSNRRTFEAGHNQRRVGELVDAFRTAREGLVARLDQLDEGDLAAEALHPRLREPTNVTGLCFFVAEHDDHHLATIRSRLRTIETPA